MTVSIRVGDCRDLLRAMPDESVGCCVTSPPYFGLRSYLDNGHAAKAQEMGSEATLSEYITGMVEVFREVRRVLHRTGTCWVNMGSSYGPNKCDLMVPARLALALIDDAWILRSDIIWHKKAPMPESVCDRPTSAHEHIFLLAKAPRYFYDADAVREAHALETFTKNGINPETGKGYPVNARSATPEVYGITRFSGNMVPGAQRSMNPAGRNQRNVWTLGPSPFPNAHFATFPPEVARRCIAAGTSERGQCPACGVPWSRVVERGHNPYPGSSHDHTDDAAKGNTQTHRSGVPAGTIMAKRWYAKGHDQTTGWQPGCRCDAGDPVSQTVLDPFAGACTTGLVADRMGRHAILLELNPEYARMGEERIRGDAPMFANVEVAS